MYSIRFTEQADTDLLGIYVYTYNNWNEKRAILYTAGLKEAINKIANNPERIGTVDRSAISDRLSERSLSKPCSILSNCRQLSSSV